MKVEKLVAYDVKGKGHVIDVSINPIDINAVEENILKSIGYVKIAVLPATKEDYVSFSEGCILYA